MRYEELDDFAYELGIASILYDIEKKSDLNDIQRLHIDWVKGYLQRVNKTLDSILDKSYISTPHFKEVLLAIANKPEKDISREDIINYKQEFSLMENKLDNLKTNPKEFYKTEDSEYIFNFINKIEPFFQPPSVPPMTCCGEDISKYD
jgi:hypothetical protein